MGESPKTILVVDDNPDECDYIATVLEDNGYKTIRAKDGEEALTKIEAAPPDLITLDMSMPAKSGVAVYRSIKENERFKNIPIIIITGISADFEQFISTRRQVPPPEGYIKKPVVNPEDILNKVRELLPN